MKNKQMDQELSSEQLLALLEINKAITATQDRKELLKVIYKQIQIVFPFESTGLYVLDEKEQFHYEFIDEEILDQDLNANLLNRERPDYIPHIGSSVEMIMGFPPKIYNIPELIKIDNHPALQPMYDAGLREILAGPLTVGGKKIGMLTFNTSKEGSFSASDILMFQHIADQLAVAVANIMANEAILKEKKFKETLLSISEAVARVQNRKTLLEVVVSKVKSVMTVDDLAIVIFNEENTHWKDLTVFEEFLQTETSAALRAKGFDTWLPIDSLVKRMQHISGILTIEDFAEHTDFPFLDLMKKDGLKEFIHTPLQTSNKIFGFLVFDAKAYGSYSESDFPLFKAIADQLAVTVANILANEKVLHKKRLNETFLNINTVISTIKDKHVLFSRLSDILKQHFSFEDFGVFVFTQEGNYIEDWTVTYPQLSPSELNNTLNETVEGNQKIPFSEETGMPWVFDELKKSNGVCIFNLQEFAQRYPNYEQSKTLLDLGYQDSLTAILEFQNEILGFFCINSFNKEFKKEDFFLFKGITNQLAVAVANILANEEILEEKKQKEDLLKISTAASNIQNRTDLLKVIFETIRPIFPFDTPGLFIIDPENDAHYEILDDPKILGGTDLVQIKAIERGLLGRFKHRNSAVDFLSQGTVPHLFDIKKDGEKWPHPQLSLMLEGGLKQIIGISLRNGSETFGMLCFSNTDNSYTENHFPLFQAISEQVSSAVSNILSNEKVLLEKSRKEALLSISEDITAVRNKQDLMNVIFHRMKSMFNFDDAVVNCWEEDATHLLMIYSDQTSETPMLLEYKTFSEGKIKIKGTPYEEISQLREPTFYTLEYWSKNYSDFDGIKIMKKSGLIEHLVIPLYKEKKVIGVLEFHSKEKGKLVNQSLDLFKGAADQVAVAVSNILTNEEILKEKSFKETLLGISEAATNIRDREDLYKTIMEQIQPIVEFDDAVMVMISEDDTTFNHVLTMSNENRKQHRLYRDIVQQEIPIKGTPMEQILKGEDFKHYTLKNWLKKYPGFPGLILMQDTGLEHSVILKLRGSGKVFAVLLFHFKEKQDPNHPKTKLYPNIADQLSVALSNVLANEEILREKSFKETLLGISEAATNIRNREDLYRTVMDQIHPIIQFDDAVTIVLSENDTHYNHIFTASSEQTKQHENFDKLVNVALPIEGTPIEMLFGQEDDIHHYELEKDLLPQYPTYPGFILMRDMGLIDSVILKLRNSGKVFGILVFHFKEIQDPNHPKTKLYSNIADQLSVAVSTVLGNEEIQRLNEQLKQDKDYLEEEIKTAYNFEHIIGTGSAIQNVFEKIDQVADTDSTVLITGETGTGKELIARALHSRSSHSDRALIKLNCAALPAQLLESELFGHEKGAFTGATERRIGKFELANNSSIFLDEIGEIPLELQAKLLRVLQEKEIERLGGNQVIKINTRIITATNRDLEKEVAEGRFRSDLYFRLNVFPIHLPPLRDRREDIPHLALHFLRKYARKTGKKIKSFSNSSLKELMAYDWPGNIRELEHLLERQIITSKSSILNFSLQKAQVHTNTDSGSDLFQQKTLQEAEKELIFNTLKYCAGRIRGDGGAAEVLGINPSTLESRMRKLGIKREHVLNN